MVDTSPTQVSDMDQAINASKVDEYTIRGDVFTVPSRIWPFSSFLMISAFWASSSSSMRAYGENDNILILMVDFDNLELHYLVNEYI